MVGIRVGVIGWAGPAAASAREEVIAARNIMWVEIDGIRFTGATLTSVSGNWGGAGIHTTEVSFIGLPEFVYLGKDGSELT